MHSLRQRRNSEGLICGTGQGACCAGSSGECPEEAPVCSEWGYCQCAEYKPGGPECGPGFDYKAANTQESNQENASEQICGEGQGACCTGSNDGCPPEAPVCSEYGYCQCSEYQPGGPECGPGFGDSLEVSGKGNGGKICGTGPGACCAGSNEGCPPVAPVCSEWGYCQCETYQQGGPECGPGFDDLTVQNKEEVSNTCGNPECDPGFDEMIDYNLTPIVGADNNLDSIDDREGMNMPSPDSDNRICGEGQGSCCAGTNDGCPSEAPVCSEYGYCQCASYKPGDPECGPGFDDLPQISQATENDDKSTPGANTVGDGNAANKIYPRMKSSSPNDPKVELNTGQICGQGPGACCSGSNDGCPSEAPVCSEYGYCQCASYKPGDAECGPGFEDSTLNNQLTETQVCGEGQGACCAGSNDGCPPGAPVCSEWGYCQCAEYQPGGPECGPGFGTGEAKQSRSGRKRLGRKGKRQRQYNKGKSGSQLRAVRRGKSRKQKKSNRKGQASRSILGRPGRKRSRRIANTKLKQG